MYVSTSEIVQKANSIVAQCGTRDPLRIARDLGIEVMYYPFNEQRGAYKVLMRNRFIFVKNDLHPVMENIVLLHELGHDALHREEATKVGGFKEFEIFNMRSCPIRRIRRLGTRPTKRVILVMLVLDLLPKGKPTMLSSCTICSISSRTAL